MSYAALLLVTCLVTGGQTPTIKPARLIDTWEISNSGYDQEKFVFKKDGSFIHSFVSGAKTTTEPGRWRLESKKLLIAHTKGGAYWCNVRWADRPDADVIMFSPDTPAQRSYWVAEQKLIGQISGGMDKAILHEERSGAGYRIGFASGKKPHFAVDLWPMQKSDIARLKKLVVAELQKRGLKPVHPIDYDVRGF